MRHPDYDRAFHETPDYVRSAIELGIVRGKKAMKMRYKIASTLSVAAAVAVILGAAAFGAIRLGAPHPDGTLSGRPLSGPIATEAPGATAVPANATPSPMPTASVPAEPTAAPTAALADATPTLLPAATPSVDSTVEPMRAMPTPLPTATPEIYEMPSWETRTVYAVYGTAKYFHHKNVCGTQNNRRELSVADALSERLSPCPDCLSSAEHRLVALPAAAVSAATEGQQMVHYTKQGMYFHVDPDCSGMVGSEGHSVWEAFDSGRAPCPVCMEGWTFAIVKYDFFQKVEAVSTVAPSMYITTADGSSQISVVSEEMEADMSQIFPGLDLQYDDTVYVAESGFDFYFHVDPECNHLPGPTPTTVYDAIMAGLGLCPDCAPDTETEMVTSAESSVNPAAESANEGSSEMLFYYTDGGTYFHLTPNCSGMRNASAHTLKSAVSWGKRHCPACIGDNAKIYWAPVPERDEDTVYLTGHNGYYHVNPECFHSKNVLTSTWTFAEIRDSYTPCPACLPALNPVDSPRCYTSEKDALYHSDTNCPRLGEAREMTEIAAQSQGKVRCPDCASYSVDTVLTELLEATFGPGVHTAYPGCVFEREEVLGNGIIKWYVSNGDDIIQAIMFRRDEANGRVLNLSINSSEWAGSDEMFDIAFLEQLPEPILSTLWNSVDPETVFQINVEYDSDGALHAFQFGTLDDMAFNYPCWTVAEDGGVEFAGDNMQF